MGQSRQQFLRFCAVGGLGFAIDSGITLLCTQSLGMRPAPARLLAFAVAASITWALHRGFTFRTQTHARSLIPYLLLTSIGAGINFSVYMAWLHWSGSSSNQIFLAVALGSGVALVFNFLLSKHVVFKSI